MRCGWGTGVAGAEIAGCRKGGAIDVHISVLIWQGSCIAAKAADNAFFNRVPPVQCSAWRVLYLCAARVAENTGA